MNHAEPLIQWPDPILELIGFLAAFLQYGAVGFRVVALRAWQGSPDDRALAATAARRAALLGLVGALAAFAMLFATSLPEQAARQHASVMRFVASNPQAGIQTILAGLAIVGFGLASARGGGFGWALAVPSVIVGALRAALFLQWSRLVNPVHMLAAGLWIGTLFVMVVAGFSTALGAPHDRRGPAVAAMVRAFSPFALSCAAVLAAFGVLTAWLHLPSWSALWTTPYGVTLLVKLCAVGFVLALGAWNWRRATPRLGTESGAFALRRSASAELAVAAVVLTITAVLVSLPSPKETPPTATPAAAQAEPH